MLFEEPVVRHILYAIGNISILLLFLCPWLVQPSGGACMAVYLACLLWCPVLFRHRLCHIYLTSSIPLCVWPPSSHFPWHEFAFSIRLTTSSSFVLITWLITRLVFCNFRELMCCSCCLCNVFITDLITPCHSAHPSQHPHLLYV